MNPNDKYHLHPDRWNNTFNHLNHAPVLPGELLINAIYLPMVDPDNNIHIEALFYVVKSATEVIARHVSTHVHDDTQHAHTEVSHLVTYPIKDEEALKLEIGAHTMGLAEAIRHGAALPIRPDETKKPAFINNADMESNAEILAFLEENDNEEAKVSGIRAMSMLGLATKTPVATLAKKLTPATTETNNLDKMVMTMEVKKASEGKTDDERKAEEELLIAKYGKENIEALARDIKYDGVIINSEPTN